MKKSILLYLFILSLCNCTLDNNKKENLQVNSTIIVPRQKASRIVVFKNDDIVEIRDSIKIKTVLNELNNAEIDYLKFASSDRFIVYDIDNKPFFNASFRKNHFKSKGVVYKTKHELFD